MPIRYMGTKRHMAHRVRAAVDALAPAGNVVDLFSGMGSVAEALAPAWPVTTNDLLTFTATISRARFTATSPSRPANELLDVLRDDFREHVRLLRNAYRTQLRAETAALDGDLVALTRYMNDAKHVGNSQYRRRRALEASRSNEVESKYRLALLYFSAGYLSARQAIEVDALRRSIDCNLTGSDWNRAIAAWLAAVSTVVNAPGHTAQYLKPNHDAMGRRIQRTWSRGIWQCFQDRVSDLIPVGTLEWRRSNRVSSIDAISFLSTEAAACIGAVYADPPYTKDQYSRYYHVYETLCRYDFPESHGVGRYREDRYSTKFCQRRYVAEAFDNLCTGVAALGVPLILSYPSEGLLQRAGYDVEEILHESFDQVSVTSSIATDHSTLGGPTGASKIAATENIYVCQP